MLGQRSKPVIVHRSQLHKAIANFLLTMVIAVGLSAATGRSLIELSVFDNKAAVYGVAFSPDGKTLASANATGRICLRRVSSGRLVRRLKEGSVVYNLLYSPDGKSLAAADGKGVRLWNVTNGRVQRTLRHQHCAAIAFSPNGKTLATAGGVQLSESEANGEVKLWELPSGRLRRSVKMDIGATSLCYSPDGHQLAIGCSDYELGGHVALLNPDTGKVERTLKRSDDDVNMIDEIAWSPDGETLATATVAEEVVTLWDMRTLRPTATLKGDAETITALAWSPDGRTLASGSRNNTVKVWDKRTGRPQRTLKGHKNWVTCVAYSPDGALLATGSADHTIRIWRILHSCGKGL